MKTLSTLALVAVIASCHFDKLFTGGGGTQLSHDPPAGLAFTARPGPAHVGQPLDPILVAVIDAAGTRVAGADSLITISLAANPSTATLTGTSTAHAVNGVARFADLTINKPGSGYTLTATVAGLTPDTSAAFDVMPPPTTTGDLTVATTTGGASPDPDGYTVTVDAGANQHVPPTGNVTFQALPSGNHAVVLTDVAGNCTVTGGPSRTVDVPPAGSRTVSFSIDCPTPTPTTGDLTVTTTTGGTGSDPNGYTLSVDGATQPIAMNDTRTITGLLAGNHSVGLLDVASNCVVSGQNPRTVNVPAGSATQTNFAITCTAPANLPPTAAFTPSCNFLDCSFTSTSSDPDGVITSQQWNFGDNTTGSGANPSHHYALAGTYKVTLTVTDDRGASTAVSNDVVVTAPPVFNQPPVVTAGPEQKVLVGLLFTLTGASFSDPDHDAPWTVTINWGDGTSPTTFPMASEGTINGSHSYAGVAFTVYTLSVTVEDAHGNRSTASKTVNIALL
jgi:PKD repeat protein